MKNIDVLIHRFRCELSEIADHKARETNLYFRYQLINRIKSDPTLYTEIISDLISVEQDIKCI